MTLPNELEKFRIGMSIGMISQNEFIQWVDEQIVKLDDPPYSLIDIAFNSLVPQEQLIKIVHDITFKDFFKADIDYKQIKSNLFTTIRESYLRSEISLEKGVKYLYLMSSFFSHDDVDFNMMLSLDDMFALAKNKVCYSINDVEKEFLKLIKGN